MKRKKIAGFILSMVFSATMINPAFAEIIWTPDKLPAGYTTNEWENKNFNYNVGSVIKKDTWTFYIKDLNGNFMKNSVFAGGSRTDENGVYINAKGKVMSYGTKDAQIESILKDMEAGEREQPAWQQDTEKPLNNNGVSNYWYGNKYSCNSVSRWVWLQESPDNTASLPDGQIISWKEYIEYCRSNAEKKSNYKVAVQHAYCFNEYGYLYTNTITPDGYQVNEKGQLMIDGKVKYIDPRKDPGNKYYGYADFPIGALGYDYESCERAAQLWGTPNPYF